MSAGKDTGTPGESTPDAVVHLRPPHRYTRTAHDVLELLMTSAIRAHMDVETDGTRIITGPRDKGPGGALRLEFEDGQVFYVDVQEEER